MNCCAHHMNCWGITVYLMKVTLTASWFDMLPGVANFPSVICCRPKLSIL